MIIAVLGAHLASAEGLRHEKGRLFLLDKIIYLAVLYVNILSFYILICAHHEKEKSLKPSESIKLSRPLFKHQAEALDRFATKNEAALFHEVGTGKTTTAICLLRAKFNQHKEISRTLIISPVATLYNWAREFAENAPEKVAQSCRVLTGPIKKRIAELKNEDFKIFITNPEGLDSSQFAESLLHFNFKNIVIDEAHRFKSHDSKRLKKLLWITDKAENRLILTGTPILNSYLDLWSQMRILDKGKTFGTNFYVYRERYFIDVNRGWQGQQGYFPLWKPKPMIKEEISGLIAAASSRVTKAECLDLPPVIYETRGVPLSDEQRIAYETMEEEMIAELNSGVAIASNALTRCLRMLQILSGYLPIEAESGEQQAVTFKSNPRLTALSDLLEDLCPNHKVIVWCTFKQNYRSIKELCEELKIEFAELTGETKDRESECARFRTDEKCRVMIANPQAGGIGINLVEANYAIYYSRNYSLGDRLQSEARNHRQGSQIHEKITVIDIVAQGTLDDDVLSALKEKEDFGNGILRRLEKKYKTKSPAIS